MTIIINPVQAIIPLGSATAEPATREERQQDLRLHQIIRATVAEGGQERVLLDLGQRRFHADTRMPLKSGQRLELMVVATSPRLELRPVEDLLREKLGQSLHLLGGRWADLSFLAGGEGEAHGTELPLLSPQARLMLENWGSLLARPGQAADGGILRQILTHLGLDLEARLAQGDDRGLAATLKGNLLEAAETLGKEGELGERIIQLLQRLEFFQLSQVRCHQQGLQMFPLLLPFLEQGFLVTEERIPAGEGEEEPPVLISLHLALQGLGNLRIDLLQDVQGIHLRLICEAPEKAAFIARFQEELKGALKEFRLQGVSFASGAESPARSLIRKLLPEGNGVLDTRV